MVLNFCIKNEVKRLSYSGDILCSGITQSGLLREHSNLVCQENIRNFQTT